MHHVALLLAPLLAAGCQRSADEPAPPPETDLVAETDADEDRCGRIPPEGRCEEDMLVQCVGGEKVKTECGLADCDLDDEGNYACIDPQIEGNPEPSDVDDLATLLSGPLTVDQDGIADFLVTVTDDTTSFLVSATVPDDVYVWLDALYAPDGRVIDLANPTLSTAIFADMHMTLAWPSRDQDGPLQPGDWRVALRVTNHDGYAVPGTQVAVDLLLKTDDADDAGQLRVALVWAGVTTVDPDLGRGVDLAINAWRRLYARYGLQLLVDQYVADSLPARMPIPQADATLWASLSATTAPVDLLLVLAEDFADSSDQLLGIAGQIPGTPTAGPRAGVLVSWGRHAGRDGELDDQEVSFLASTFAHEIGHFAGLFHPVELDWESLDPLDGTPACSSESGCFEKLGDNVMFPHSTCWTADCEDLLILSDDQVGVMQLYPGTL